MIRCLVAQELQLAGRENLEFVKETRLAAVLPVSSCVKLNLSSGVYTGRVLKVSASEDSELVEFELYPVSFQDKRDFERLRDDFVRTPGWEVRKTWRTA